MGWGEGVVQRKMDKGGAGENQNQQFGANELKKY